MSIYEYWLDFTLNALDNEPEKVIDLACGTGWFTQLLAPFVGSIIGVDLDARMLEIAKDETKHVSNIRFMSGDMTNLAPTFQDVDVVTCYLDSLCFLNDFASVQKALNEVYRVLNKGGVFLFDVWTPYQIIEGFKQFEYFDYDDSAALLWESNSNEAEISVTHNLTVFELQARNNLYARKESQLIERTYPLEYYLTALKEAGFALESIEVYTNYGQKLFDRAEDQETERWFFRCYK